MLTHQLRCATTSSSLSSQFNSELMACDIYIISGLEFRWEITLATCKVLMPPFLLAGLNTIINCPNLIIVSTNIQFKGDERWGQTFSFLGISFESQSVSVSFLRVAIYNLKMWEYLCQMKLVALFACHNLYCQSHLSMALLINTSCLSFGSDLKHHDPLNTTEKKPPRHVVLDNQITLLLKRKKNLICLFVSCIPTHPHNHTL